MKGRYLIILASLCGLIASGVGLITNVAGLFFNPIAEELGLLRGAVSMTVTINNLLFALGGLMSPRFMTEKTLKPGLIIGTAVVAGSTALLSATSSIMIMYILNALRGFASGVLGFVFVTMVINNWFHSNVGLASSIAMAFSGLAGAVFSPIVSAVIQSSGWRTAYLMTAVMMAVLNLPSILLLPAIDPASKGMKPLGEKTENKAAETSTGSVLPVVMPMLVIMCVYAACGAGSTALTQHFTGIAEERGLAASVGATMLSACMLANTGGKIVLGALVDRIGAKKSLLTYACLIMCAVLIMLFIPSGTAMYIAAFLFGLTYSMATVGVVSITKDLFGLGNYSRTYPKINLCGTMFSAAFSSIIGFMYDAFGSYNVPLFIIMAMAAIDFIIILYVYKTIDARKKNA
ncbi:MAG: MFS transporter [Solobacterium sp.]|nr:MFS transporter [Solobacterium sp.]